MATEAPATVAPVPGRTEEDQAFLFRRFPGYLLTEQKEASEPPTKIPRLSGNRFAAFRSQERSRASSASVSSSPSHLQRQSTLTSLSVGNWKRATLIGTRRIPVPTGIKEDMVTPLRNRLQANTIALCQILRSWYDAGVISDLDPILSWKTHEPREDD
ncbi:hypothetical protein N657DRAFT_651411 [Parathielavia appendiculata]|uniref:Uncharacterized protein n=1 Tax=Parathielavia appendiculata TaxID=2587402 RepID=A0AAN6YYJ7_9PEZI|nr:hypothetical protein N657DRAFT_651411 [Parathielavia appendiculata]